MERYGRHYFHDRHGLDDGDPFSDCYDGEYPGDDYDAEDEYFDDYDYEDEIGYTGRDIREYEREFDRAAREMEKSRRSPAAKILTGLLIIAAALTIWLGVSAYMSEDRAEEPDVRVSFVRADGETRAQQGLAFPGLDMR